MSSTKTCPCGSGHAYLDCCLPFHRNERYPNTAEALMRSRYSAYEKKCIQYLVDTTHPQKRSSNLHASIESWSNRSTWLKLEVLKTQQGQPDDKIGKVEFKAHYISDGKPFIHHELSRFKRHQNRWYYLDGKTF